MVKMAREYATRQLRNELKGKKMKNDRQILQNITNQL